MRVKISKQSRTTEEVEVEFPIYVRWTGGDHTDVYHRLDNIDGKIGRLVTITKDIGAYDQDFPMPSFEIKTENIRIDPLSEDYVRDRINEPEFLKVLREVEAVLATISSYIPKREDRKHVP